PFQQRLDRHGKPFGDRVSSASLRPPGPRNKIAANLDQPRPSLERAKTPDAEQNEQSYTSPPYTRRRTSQAVDRRRDNRREQNHRSPNLQWRPKSPVLNQEVTPPKIPIHEEGPADVPETHTRKRGRPPKVRDNRNVIRLSPKSYSGMGSKKRNLVRLQASPGSTS
ncbi:hypothetical protein IGI04_025188, partial [Brassica rapa subsp. trilocularis]